MKEKIRLVRNLQQKRNVRRKEQRFVIEGPHLIEEVLLRFCGASEDKPRSLIDFVIYSENLPIVEKLQKKGIECLRVSKKQFAEVSDVETPQGILAVVRESGTALPDVLKSKNPLLVFCVGIQDPGNLGTIIRTADAVAASGVIISRGTVDLYNPKVIRSTMGSVFHLPIIQDAEINETIRFLKEQKIRLVAADLAGQMDHFAIKYDMPTTVVVGNEGSGLPREVVDLCDEKIKIPMPGKAESLNVGISTAVMLYEALRQRTHAR